MGFSMASKKRLYADYEKKMSLVWPYHYNNYDSKERFCSYWHQINEVLSPPSEQILEVGIRNGRDHERKITNQILMLSQA